MTVDVPVGTRTAPDLDRLLGPRSVAVVGASDRPGSLGQRTVANLRIAGDGVRVHLVNPGRTELGGVPCHRDLASVPEEVDVALVAVPRSAVDQVLSDAPGRAANVVLFTSGFAEVGDVGGQRLVEELHRRGVGVLGPNTAGMYTRGVPLTFSKVIQEGDRAEVGVALLSQSGAFGARLWSAARSRGLPVHSFVNTGNEAGYSVGAFLAALPADDRVRGALVYVENFAHWADIEAGMRAATGAGVPVSVLVGGRTAQGSTAAASHTGAMLTSDARLMDAAVTAAGGRLVSSDEELLDAGRAAMSVRAHRARRIGVVSISGGAGVVLSDLLTERGFEVPPLTPGAQARLGTILPSYASFKNPIDVSTSFLTDQGIIGATIAELVATAEVDGVVCYADLELLPSADALRGLGVPVTACVTDLTPEQALAAARSHVPLFPDMSRAIRALESSRAPQPAAPAGPGRPLPDVDCRRHSGALTLLESCAVPVAAWLRLTDLGDLDDVLGRFGAPDAQVVLKGDVPAEAHKRDLGAIAVGSDLVELRRDAERLLEDFGAVVVQRFVPDICFEILATVRLDPVFGQVAVLGWGGSDVEEIDRFEIALGRPGAATVESMLAASGVGDAVRRWLPPGSTGRAQLVDTLVELFAVELTDALPEIEVNPIVVTAGGAVLAVDSRVVAADPPVGATCTPTVSPTVGPTRGGTVR